MTYVRLYWIDENELPDWDNALMALQSSEDIEDAARTARRLKEIFERPQEHRVRSFQFRGAKLFLAAADEWDDDAALNLVREVEETDALESAGFRAIATAVRATAR